MAGGGLRQPQPPRGGIGQHEIDRRGSADFLESKIVAEVYAQALQANGFSVGRRLGIGSRETYIPALKDHSIDLVPEYIGNLLLYFQPDSTVTMLDAVELELYKRLPGDLSILTPSPASDTDTVTVTAATAAMWNLKTIADLAPHSPEVKLAARRRSRLDRPVCPAAAEVRA
ncbi:substrate binding domain of ABC-type glycine betaine transport system family protein [Mycobacterium xenopi 3993]|nr:substrate binding domain of ABC-type glycine betaine transport system family protein [Mycobacterium xenopi 3993]